METTVTLYALPFAGGSSFSYLALRRHLPGSVRLRALELPGHGRRHAEPLHHHTDALVDDLVRQVDPTGPYALFGHSMGAMLAYLLADRLRATPPRHLFCSGYRAPVFMPPVRQAHRLPRAEFLRVIRDYGGMPPALLDDPDEMRFFEPILRADLRALETYTYHAPPPLPLPLTVWYGQDDTLSPDEIGAWQRETTYPLTTHAFPGHHFYLYDHWPDIGRRLHQALSQTLSQTPAPAPVPLASDSHGDL